MISLTNTEKWTVDGLCQQIDPELFFPERASDTRAAKLICNSGCPVKAECLAYAMLHRIGPGVWGGTSDFDRRKMFKKSAAATPDAA